MNTDTPITDAAAFNLGVSPQGAPHKDCTPKGALIDADVARKLEHECTQLRRDIQAARNERNRAALEERQKWMPYAAQVAKLREALEPHITELKMCAEIFCRPELRGCFDATAKDFRESADTLEAALSDPAPPVVPLSEAKALVEAGNKFLQVWRSGQYYLPELEAFREALATYDANHPKP